jgi:hypothetical protein
MENEIKIIESKHRWEYFIQNIVGFIGLVRPPDLILTLIPITWNIANYGGMKLKIKYNLI